MSYLERYEDNKKLACARVPEIILNALNHAKDYEKNEQEGLYGYSFSISRVVEMALKNTLKEIEEKTGIDFYGFEVFRCHVKDLLSNRLPLDMTDDEINSIIKDAFDEINEEYFKLRFKDSKEISMSDLIDEKQNEIEEKFKKKCWS